MSAARFSKNAMIGRLVRRSNYARNRLSEEFGLMFDPSTGYHQCEGKHGKVWLYYAEIRLCLDLINEIEGGHVK